jgi:transcriptional regulator with XRE-family HTH domain
MAKEKRPEAVTEIQKAVGARILWARKEVMPNRAALAELMDIDRSTLAKIESGDRPPSIFNVIELAHRLRVTTDYILIGSLRGVDGELAARLAVKHPELLAAPRLADTSTAKDSDRPN